MATNTAPSPVVSIIVVSYNTRDLTLRCLETVFEQTTIPFELIVIDNASNDGSADAIEASFGDRIHFIRSDTNHGFARANNIASKRARGEWLLLLSDTGLLEMGLVAITPALQAFQWSRLRSLVDYSDAAEIALRHLRFEDFLEALVRIATQMALPTREELGHLTAECRAELARQSALG